MTIRQWFTKMTSSHPTRSVGSQMSMLEVLELDIEVLHEIMNVTSPEGLHNSITELTRMINSNPLSMSTLSIYTGFSGAINTGSGSRFKEKYLYSVDLNEISILFAKIAQTHMEAVMKFANVMAREQPKSYKEICDGLANGVFEKRAINIVRSYFEACLENIKALYSYIDNLSTLYLKRKLEGLDRDFTSHISAINKLKEIEQAEVDKHGELTGAATGIIAQQRTVERKLNEAIEVEQKLNEAIRND